MDKPKGKPFIYMDNAATTRVLPEVLDAMLPYFTENYANVSGVYSFAYKAREAVEAARQQAAELIGARAEEIYFTGGGSESDNWALRSSAELGNGRGRHIITSAIEHHAVINTCRYLEKQGYEVTYAPANAAGFVSPDVIERAIRSDTVLISVMAANNEIGTIQPIKEIGEVARRHGVLFHTDAVQAYGHIPLDVDGMNIDMLSASGHKFNGPKGAGFLYVRRNIKLPPFINGGMQERGRRAGTLNTAGIIGMGHAAHIAGERMQARKEKLDAFREHLIDRVLAEIPKSRLNGDRRRRLSNNADFCFEGIEGESLMIMLDMNGICASSASACAAGQSEPSHVLTAIGVPEDIAKGSLRLTMSEDNTIEQVDYTVDRLKECIKKLRDMSKW